MKATIDGVLWTATRVSAGIQSGSLVVVGFDSVLTSINMSTPATTGTRTVSLNSMVQATLTSSAGAWEADSFGVVTGSGTVTVLTLTATGASGTFSFTVTPVTGTAATGTKSIVNGTFSVIF